MCSVYNGELIEMWVKDRMFPLSLSFPSFHPRLKMLHRRGVDIEHLNNPESNKWCWPPQFYEKIYTFQFWQIVSLDTLIQILLGTIFRTKLLGRDNSGTAALVTPHTNINVSILQPRKYLSCEHTMSNIHYVCGVLVVDIMKNNENIWLDTSCMSPDWRCGTAGVVFITNKSVIIFHKCVLWTRLEVWDPKNDFLVLGPITDSYWNVNPINLWDRSFVDYHPPPWKVYHSITSPI